MTILQCFLNSNAHISSYVLLKQAPRLLPLLLFRLSQVCQSDSPDLILPILNALPKTVTHKICVGPVLRTLQGLGESNCVSPLALRLITELWKKQVGLVRIIIQKVYFKIDIFSTTTRICNPPNKMFYIIVECSFNLHPFDFSVNVTFAFALESKRFCSQRRSYGF